MPDSRTTEAIALMNNFAQRTGLTSEHQQQRYLWTDAFAVCNFLGLTRVTGDQHFTNLALQLVNQVHHTLGQYQVDDTRSGWISGLQEKEGENHPTRGGLRIGKALPERGQNEPFDERLEWDRDGQYFHYLTKWMHALDQVTRATGQIRFNSWARELAETAYTAFTYPSSAGGPRSMYWKMSIDLTRALVPSMGQHDPLDGYITYMQLRSTAAHLPAAGGESTLANEIDQLSVMSKNTEWTTADPLGIGGLLIDAYRVDQLMRLGTEANTLLDDQFLEALLSASLAGLQYYATSRELQMPAEYRLAFRELGLAIGLHAVEWMLQADASKVNRSTNRAAIRAQLKALKPYIHLRDKIESFWRDPDHQRVSIWLEHRDINEVMLATSLAPDGFLALLPSN